MSLEEFDRILADLEPEYPYPSGRTLEERAIGLANPRTQQPALTRVAVESAPTGFFNSTVFTRSKFFGDDSIRFSKIEESLQFYRDHLNNEYQSLLRQANLTYRLWLGCVGLGFLVLQRLATGDSEHRCHRES
jgi:hypothetical protein